MEEHSDRSDPDLIVAPVAPAAARYAVEHWHYSARMPSPPLVSYGAWEHSRYIGAVIFGRGGAPHLASSFAVGPYEIAELVRIALRVHDAPVSQIGAAAVAALRRSAPGLRVLVSYADPYYGHHGGIYQAMNWLYLGTTSPAPMYRHRATGELLHSRSVSPSGYKRHYGVRKPSPRTDQCDLVRMPGKHRYVLPLDRPMRRRLSAYARPYPLRGGSVEGDTPVSPDGRGRFDPGSPLSETSLQSP